VEYNDFIESKAITTASKGFAVSVDEINPLLFDFQRDIVRWALAKGRAAIFADCGDGKTAMQLEWAEQIRRRTSGNVLIVAPLAARLKSHSPIWKNNGGRKEWEDERLQRV